MKKVAIILLNYNGNERKFEGEGILPACIRRLVRTNYKNFKLIVVDNGSTDNSLEIIKSYECDLIRFKKNRYNFSFVNNSGILYAIKKYDVDYVILLSNDVFVEDRNWVKKFVNTAEAHKKCGILTCKLVYPTGRIQQAGGIIGISPRSRGRGEIDRGQYDKLEIVETSTAAACMIRRKLIDKIGLLDENFKFGFEDTDYFIRAKNAGFTVMYDGKICLTHLEGYTHVNSPKMKTRDRFFENNQKNLSYFIFKNFGLMKRIMALPLILLSAIFSIESSTRPRKFSNLRFKDRIFWRMRISIVSIFKGYILYKNYKKINNRRM